MVKERWRGLSGSQEGKTRPRVTGPPSCHMISAVRKQEVAGAGAQASFAF